MPPANNHHHHQPGPPSPSYVSALSEALESPDTQTVYNLASTLTAQAESPDTETIHNLAHTQTGRRLASTQQQTVYNLASSASAGASTSTNTSTSTRPADPPATAAAAAAPDDTSLRYLRAAPERDRSERLRRVMNRLGRLHDDGRAAYGDRVPNSNHLYDWSPSNETAAVTDDNEDEDELDQILAELRREQPNTHPEILRVLGRSQLDSERERSRAIVSRVLDANQPSPSPSQSQSHSHSQSADSSLRSTAILQSVRRHARFSARTRESDPSRAMLQDSDPSHARVRDRDRERERERERDRDVLARVDSYRRSYLDRASNASPTPAVSPMLEQTIQYLSRIRYSNSLDDSLNYALDAGFLSKDYLCDDHRDFVLDSLTIPPPPESSWLAPGAVLSGCQHATSVTSTVTTAATGPSTTLYRFRNNDSLVSTAFDPPSRPWLSHNSSATRSRASQAASPETVTSHVPQQDRWPVKVTIHSVDYDRMSLAATMEAYNVPSHPHQHQSFLSGAMEGTTSFTRTSSITTYLEGEILDFNTHTLLTESFNSSASNDATYWRKLPPFQMFTDAEVIRNLSSRRWFNDVLSKEWILMRWKERCFVKSLNRSTSDSQHPPSSTTTAIAVSTPPTSFHSSSRENGGDAEHGTFDDSGCGLTISGFYYVCLRRSDGRVEGLYYDPQSSPYQCLKLESVGGGAFPAWGFR